jgi:hypothetical protein
MRIEDCVGYKRLLAAVEHDEKEWPGAHNYRGKLEWVINRVNHYADKTGLPSSDILDSWEKRRDYWYMGYYQDANQPEIKGDKVRVFENREALAASIGNAGFRCPACNGISQNPTKCDTGLEMSKGKICDWKAYGLFGTLGKGVTVFLKDGMILGQIFYPIAWEVNIEANQTPQRL